MSVIEVQLFLFLIVIIRHSLSINLEHFLTLNNQTGSPLSTLDNIILETLKSSPRDVKSYLPSLPKIVTRSGLMCDFPFTYNKNEYYDSCATFKNGLQYCKIHFKSSITDEVLNEDKLFHSFTDPNSQIKLVKIKNEYFSECLSLDETERYLGNIVENSNGKDFKNTLLKKLFQKIKLKIKEVNQEKLNLLYELSESYCKSANFNFDCLYDNLILPISKTEELKQLTKNILEVVENYKSKIKKLVSDSLILETQREGYLFIKENNLKYDSSNGFRLSQIDDEEEIQTILNKNLLQTNSLVSKMSFGQFSELLVTVFENCTEECRLSLEYLFIENFAENIERIKIEIISKLFHLNKVNESELNLIFDKDKYKLKYDNSTYDLNLQSERFINYNSWSIRYLISILHRYILMEKLFFTEIIKGNLNEESFSLILYPNNSYPSERQTYQLIKIMPMIKTFIEYSKQIKIKLENIYQENYNFTSLIKNNIQTSYNILSAFENITVLYSHLMTNRTNYIKHYGNNTIQEIKLIKNKAEYFTNVLSETTLSNSFFRNIKIKSESDNLSEIIKQIYKNDELPQQCYNFLHYHTYYYDYTYGKPKTNYIYLGFEPYFNIIFEKEIKLFFIYGTININPGNKIEYNITIITKADFDLYIENENVQPALVSEIYNSERIKNVTKSVFKLTTSEELNSNLELKLKGRYNGLFDEADDKILEFSITTSDNENLFYHNQEKTQVDSKCNETIRDVSLCFDKNSYYVSCSLACKHLSDRLKESLLKKEKLKIIETDLIGESEYISKRQLDFWRLKNSKYINTTKLKDDELLNFKTENKVRKFSLTCKNYCEAFKWSISVYKCLYRNIEYKDFGSLLIKCGATGDWKIMSRKPYQINSKTFEEVSGTNILLGKQFFIENTPKNLKSEYIQYIQPSLFNPVTNISFVNNFDYNEILEYMFATGDMENFLVVDKLQPFIKGSPFIAYTNYNHRILNKTTSQNPDVYYTSIFNLNYEEDTIDNKGIIIYSNLYDSNNSKFVMYSDNTKFNKNKNSELRLERNKIFEENQGENIYTRKDDLICLNFKLIYKSNLQPKEYYIENSILTKSIFSFTNQNYLILRLPKELDQTSVLLRTKAYQTKYSLQIYVRSKIFMAVEVNDHFAKIAEILSKDNWIFMDGKHNRIELISSDIGDDILNRQDEYSFYECNFASPNNPVCNQNIYRDIGNVKMSIFYKFFDRTLINIFYSFFDFEDLYGCLHLLFIKPLECNLEKSNLFAYKDKVNNYMRQYVDYLPTYNSNIEKYIKKIKKNEHGFKNVTFSQTVKLNATTIIENPNLSKAVSSKINQNEIANFVSFVENFNLTFVTNSTMEIISKMKINSTLAHESHNLIKHFYKKIITSQRNYTSSKIRISQFGCVFALDVFGNLFLKQLKNKIKNSYSSNFNESTEEMNPFNPKWEIVKKYVKYFEINENLVIILDFHNNLQIYKSYKQNNKCVVHNNRWEYLKIDGFSKHFKSKIKQISLSDFNCLWFTDESNSIFTIPKFDKSIFKNGDYVLSSKEVKVNKIPKLNVKNIIHHGNQIYILSRDNKIYIGTKIYDMLKNECSDKLKIKDVKLLNEDLKFQNIEIKKFSENIYFPLTMLDKKGKIYSRRYTNDVNPYGLKWEKLEILDKENYENSHLRDFDMNSKDLITINSNGKIQLFYDINRPRYKDI